MSKLALITKVPGVTGAVLSDAAGVHLDAAGNVDGEAAAAVMAFLTSALGQAGEALGLGALRKVAFAGPTGGCVVGVGRDAVVTAFVASPAAAAAVDKTLDAMLEG
jgi:predicted regulator of Ras-like GTPase activity (Roadblock/LC7/MglB family)